MLSRPSKSSSAQVPVGFSTVAIPMQQDSVILRRPSSVSTTNLVYVRRFCPTISLDLPHGGPAMEVDQNDVIGAIE